MASNVGGGLIDDEAEEDEIIKSESSSSSSDEEEKKADVVPVAVVKGAVATRDFKKGTGDVIRVTKVPYIDTISVPAPAAPLPHERPLTLGDLVQIASKHKRESNLVQKREREINILQEQLNQLQRQEEEDVAGGGPDLEARRFARQIKATEINKTLHNKRTQINKQREQRKRDRDELKQKKNLEFDSSSSSSSSSDEDDENSSIVPQYITTRDLVELYNCVGPTILSASKHGVVRLIPSVRKYVLKAVVDLLNGRNNVKSKRQTTIERTSEAVREQLSEKPESVELDRPHSVPLHADDWQRRLAEARESGDVAPPSEDVEKVVVYSFDDPRVYVSVMLSPWSVALHKFFPSYFVDVRWGKVTFSMPFSWVNPATPYVNPQFFRIDSVLLVDTFHLSLWSTAINYCCGKVVLADKEVSMCYGIYLKLRPEVQSSFRILISMASVISRGLTGHPNSMSEKILFHIYNQQMPDSSGKKSRKHAHYTFLFASVLILGGPMPVCDYWTIDEFFLKCLAARCKWPLFGRTVYHAEDWKYSARFVNLFELRKQICLNSMNAMAKFIHDKEPSAKIFDSIGDHFSSVRHNISSYFASPYMAHLQRFTHECLDCRKSMPTSFRQVEVSKVADVCRDIKASAEVYDVPGKRRAGEFPRAAMLWLSRKLFQLYVENADNILPDERRSVFEAPGFEQHIFNDYDAVSQTIETSGFVHPKFRVTPQMFELSYNIQFLFSQTSAANSYDPNWFLDPFSLAGRVCTDNTLVEVAPAAYKMSSLLWRQQYKLVQRAKREWIKRKPALRQALSQMTWAPSVDVSSSLYLSVVNIDVSPTGSRDPVTKSTNDKAIKLTNLFRSHLTMISVIDDLMSKKSNKKRGDISQVPNVVPKYRLKDTKPISARASVSGLTADIDMPILSVSLLQEERQKRDGDDESNEEDELLENTVAEGLTEQERMREIVDRSIRRFKLMVRNCSIKEKDAMITKHIQQLETQMEQEREKDPAHSNELLLLERKEYERLLSKSKQQRLTDNVMDSISRRFPAFDRLVEVMTKQSASSSSLDSLRDKLFKLSLEPTTTDATRLHNKEAMMRLEEMIQIETEALRSELMDKLGDAIKALEEDSVPMIESGGAGTLTLRANIKSLIANPNDETLLHRIIDMVTEGARTESQIKYVQNWSAHLRAIQRAALEILEDADADDLPDLVQMYFTDEDELPEDLKMERAKQREKKRKRRTLLKHDKTQDEIVDMAMGKDLIGAATIGFTPEEQAELEATIESVVKRTEVKDREFLEIVDEVVKDTEEGATVKRFAQPLDYSSSSSDDEDEDEEESPI